MLPTAFLTRTLNDLNSLLLQYTVHFVWASVYLIVLTIFYLASSPFVGIRQVRQQVETYLIVYLVMLCWMFAGLVGHTPLFQQVVNFDINVTASLFFPIFWSSISVLLTVDLVLYRSQEWLRHKHHDWAYEKVRTKVRIPFGRTVFDMALSSVAVAVLCCVLHASSITRSGPWLLPRNQPERMDKFMSYIRFFFPETTKVVVSPLFGVWLTCISILIVQHFIERTTEVRGVFWKDDESEFTGQRLSIRDHPSIDHRDNPIKDYPVNILPMCEWFSWALTQTVLDMLIHLKLFAGRFDKRQLMACYPDQDDGDPFFYDHSLDENGEKLSELWFDFVADCGDGFHSSYAMARLLAQPFLLIEEDDKGDEDVMVKQLPRGKLLVIGGDLAYPRPTYENFEERFVRVFEDAMPPPRWYDPDHVAVDKPDIPEGEKLRQYKGPVAYAVPGNHDWFDGLENFLRFMVFRNWLGGWLLPQKRSYFTLKLPHDWYILCMDNGLSQDVDCMQAAYFTRVAKSLPETAKVIVVTHDPN